MKPFYIDKSMLIKVAFFQCLQRQRRMFTIHSLFNSTFKTNPYMERGLMTGVTCVTKESIFSDLNNLEVVTTISQKYNKQFGFTFGDLKDIYNPWSITCFLEKSNISHIGHIQALTAL